MSKDWKAEWSTYVEEVRAIGLDKLADFIGRDIDIVAAGRGTYKCSSPLRAGDSDPSFFIYPDGRYWDFGAGQGGDIIQYARARHGLNFKDAIERIAETYGVMTWEERKRAAGGGEWIDAKDAVEAYKRAEHAQEIFSAMTNVVLLCHSMRPRQLTEYLIEHYCLSLDYIDMEKIGYVPAGLFEICQDEFGYDEELLLRTGFFAQTGKGPQAAQTHRILFPYWYEGLCRYTIGRLWFNGVPQDQVNLPEWDKGKYKKHLTHSPDKHPYVDPCISNELLWGEDCVRHLSKQVSLGVAEGITDAMIVSMLGLPVVSPVTTSISNKQIDSIVRMGRRAKEVVIYNDNDTARDGSNPGDKGAERTARILAINDIPVRIATLPRPDGTTKIDINELVGAKLKEHGWLGNA